MTSLGGGEGPCEDQPIRCASHRTRARRYRRFRVAFRQGFYAAQDRAPPGLLLPVPPGIGLNEWPTALTKADQDHGREAPWPCEHQSGAPTISLEMFAIVVSGVMKITECNLLHRIKCITLAVWRNIVVEANCTACLSRQ